MAIIFDLTSPESVAPIPELRDDAAVNVDRFIMMELRTGSSSASVLIEGIQESGIAVRVRDYAILDAEHIQQLFTTPLLPADYAADLTTNQAATGGTTSTVVKSGAGWTPAALIGKTIVFTGGTNGNADGSVRAYIVDNTSDTISFDRGVADDFTVACNSTTTFKVFAGLKYLLERMAMILAMDQLGKAGALE